MLFGERRFVTPWVVWIRGYEKVGSLVPLPSLFNGKKNVVFSFEMLSRPRPAVWWVWFWLPALKLNDYKRVIFKSFIDDVQ